MPWSHRSQQGFALGAVLCDDRAAAQASAGLREQVRAQASAVAVQLAAAGRAERQHFVREMLVESARVSPRSPRLTAAKESSSRARALSLLAAEVAPELGRRWLAAAPLPRAGYRPSPGLLCWLRRHLLESQR